MKVIKCDRCGKEYTKNEGVFTDFKPLSDKYGSSVLRNSVSGIDILFSQVLSNGHTCTGENFRPDLCDECIAGLVKYLENKQ